MSGKSWWRAWAEACHDPKLLSLSLRDRWHWHEALSFACLHGGRIQSADHLRRFCGLRADVMQGIVQRLCDAGLLEPDGTGGFVPHNWNGRQFKSDSSTERTRKYRQRERHSDVPCDGPEQNRTEQIRKKDSVDAAAKSAAAGSNGIQRSKASKDAKGTRLPEDWLPLEADLAYAHQRGLNGQQLSDEIEKFKNHWLAKAGREARKINWPRTWHNWVLNARSRKPLPPKERILL